MAGKHILASIGLLMLLTANGAMAAYDVGLYCQLVITGTKLPSFDSCQDYFVCQKDGYTEESCPATESFDKNSQSCKPASAVKCNYGAENPCANVADGFVQNPENCYAWIGCKNEVETHGGTCPDQQYYDVTLGRCEWGTCTNNQGDDIVPIENLCEIMANGAFFGDFKDCKAYHKCVDGKIDSGSCKGTYVYIASTGWCNAQTSDSCSRIENGSAPPTEVCTVDGTTKGDSVTCSVYYECQNSNWITITCDTNQYYDVVAKKCVNRQSARATEGCNRCQFANTQWVNGVDPTCELYLTCNTDGTIAAQGNCTTGTYFNEQRQACFEDNGGLTDYRKKNGACYEPAETDEPTCNEGDEGCGGTTTCGPDDEECNGTTTCQPGDEECNETPGCQPGEEGCDDTPSCQPGEEGCGDTPSCEPGDEGCDNTPTCEPGDEGCDETPACEPGDEGCDETPACEPGDEGCDETPACEPGDEGCDETPACEPGDEGCDETTACDPEDDECDETGTE